MRSESDNITELMRQELADELRPTDRSMMTLEQAQQRIEAMKFWIQRAKVFHAQHDHRMVGAMLERALEEPKA